VGPERAAEGRSVWPHPGSAGVAEGDAYPPFEVKPAVSCLSNQVVRGKPAKPHDDLNPTGFHQGLKPAGLWPARAKPAAQATAEPLRGRRWLWSARVTAVRLHWAHP